MRRFVVNIEFVLAGLLLWIPSGWSADDRPSIREALSALQRGDFAAAEQKLRADVQTHPNDAPALTLLGVALDNLGKLREADEVHRRALANAPRSIDVLNNYGNHLVGAGKEDQARKVYLQVVALDAAQFNANVQLARLALKEKSGPEALGYLKHLPASQQDAPQIAVLRLTALRLAGDRAGADAQAERLSAATGADLGMNFSVGLVLANASQYDLAESFFTKALAAAPSDFNVLVNLGVVASHAGHNERARDVLETALRQQPQNVDVLYNLALVDIASKQTEAALRLLAQAARQAPQRADIQKLLAITTGDLGALEDAAAAWDRYLKLDPNDDFGRRERGFTAIQMGKFEQGMPDLEGFVARHPDDPVGHFELGQAESRDDPAKGLAHLDRALALKPDFAAAHAFRGSLYYQSGRFEAALTDLEAAARLRPDDALMLDRLGQTYSALEKTAEAVRTLRRASELAPGDSKIMLHFARALAEAGNAGESKAAMDRFRQLGAVSNKSVPAGLVDYLSLTPEQQHADYRARVEKAARANPGDAAAEVNLLKVLLDDGNLDQAAATAHRIAGLKPAPPVAADAGRALLESKQYPAARELLEQAAAAGSLADVALDLAIATFHATGAREGLQRLDHVPEAGRSGDYYLTRAEMLDSSGKPEEAASALNQALQRAPRRVDLHRQAMVFLAGKGQFTEALGLLDRAVRTLPQSREILLMRATTLELAGRTEDAGKLLGEMQNRWPEWHAIWVAHGVVLASHQHFEDARQALETAVALGARSSEAYYYLAESSLRSTPHQLAAAEAAIREAGSLAPDDAWIKALAGRIAAAKARTDNAVNGAEQPPFASRLFLGKAPRDW
jgi:tetratricopeptide (TPR) repeat protein